MRFPDYAMSCPYLSESEGSSDRMDTHYFGDRAPASVLVSGAGL